MHTIATAMTTLTVALLVGCQSVPPRPVVDEPRAKQTAIEQVIASSTSDDPFLRANAIEASQYLPQRVSQLAHLGLSDDNEAVRFVALATIGRLKLKSLVPSVPALMADESASVRAAVLFALRRCGEPVDLTPMAAMLAQPDPGLRGNVAMLLGELGEPSAMSMLMSIGEHRPDRQVPVEREEIVRLQFAEALVKLGDPTALEVLRAKAYSNIDEVRIAAVQMLGRLADRQAGAGLVTMLGRDPVQLRLAAADSLARMGHYGGLEVVLAGSEYEQAPIRAQAAIALGSFEASSAAGRRLVLLSDPVEQVRLAAAAAVLRAQQTDQP